MNRQSIYFWKWKKFGVFLSLLLLIGLNDSVNAQQVEPENAFVPVQITESSLTTVQSERLTVLQQNSLLEQPIFIELPDELHQILALRFFVVLTNDFIQTSMLVCTKVVIAKCNDVTSKNYGYYTWSGE